MTRRKHAAVLAAATALWGCAPSLAAHPAPGAAAHASPTAEVALLTTPAAGSALTTDTTLVSVTGVAAVNVPSDRARVSLAVETEGSTAGQAADENARLMDRIIAAVAEVSGEGATTQTAAYQINPRYTNDRTNPEGRRISGYQALNTLVVTLDEVERASAVLDAALDAGANRIDGLSFFASDTEPARLEAIRMATLRARAEADAVAGALGLTVRGAQSVNISGGAMPQPAFRGAMQLEAAVATPLESGSQMVQVSVSISWILAAEEGR